MTPNNRNLGHGRFTRLLVWCSGLSWVVVRHSRRKHFVNCLSTRPNGAFVMRGKERSGFGIMRSGLDVATPRLRGCRRVPSPLWVSVEEGECDHTYFMELLCGLCEMVHFKPFTQHLLSMQWVQLFITVCSAPFLERLPVVINRSSCQVNKVLFQGF